MIRWGVTPIEFATASPKERWVRGDELGIMEYREPEYNPVTGEELEEGCYMMAHNTPDGLCDPITGCPGCAQERRRRAREGK